MTLANLLLGLGIGLPMMIAVGPISVLLLDQGLERGMRVAAPAAFGVASADLSLSILASIAGASIAAALGPFTLLLTMAAVLVLVVLAVSLGRAALAELRRARRRTAATAPVPVLAGTMGSSTGELPVDDLLTDDLLTDGVRTDDLLTDGAPERAAAFSRLTGVRLAAAFYGFTLVNPLTLVLFASVVVAGGAGVGTAGWALGMALASLIAHGGFVVAGGLLRSRLSPVASGRLRLGSAVFMAGLAVHFAAGI